MKSVQRHNLETNWLAKHLKIWIEKAQPYTSTIAGVLIGLVVLVLVWNWIMGSSATRRTEAWDVFNAVIGQRALNAQSLTELNRASEEFQGTSMEPLANLTWADGQVWTASREILFDRKVASTALDGAAGMYQALLDTSTDEQILDRARFGLARVYELRNEPEKAREEYLKVKTTYAAMAKLRAEELAKEKTKAALSWLAMAEIPRAAPPAGGGTPGQRPLFDVPDFNLPGATGGTPTNPAEIDKNLEEFFKGVEKLDLGSGDAKSRYEGGDAKDQKAEGEKTPAKAGMPAADGAKTSEPAADKSDKAPANAGK